MPNNAINIKAIFKGKDGSCGYETNKEYSLEIRHKANSNIKIKTNKGEWSCEYESIISFLSNWDTIRKK